MLLPLRDNSSSQDSKSSSSGNRRELFKRPLFLLPLSNGYASPDGNCNRNKKDFPTFRWALGKQVKRVKKSSEEAALPHNRSSPPHHTHTHTGGCCVSLFFSRMQSHDSGAPLLFLHLPLSPHSVHTHTHTSPYGDMINTAESSTQLPPHTFTQRSSLSSSLSAK